MSDEAWEALRAIDDPNLRVVLLEFAVTLSRLDDKLRLLVDELHRSGAFA